MTGIENYASRYTSNDIDHFITTPIPTAKSYLKGIGGDLKGKGEGTLLWNINDNQRRSHKIKIKNCLYVADYSFFLTSLQHLAKQANDNYPSPNGT